MHSYLWARRSGLGVVITTIRGMRVGAPKQRNWDPLGHELGVCRKNLEPPFPPRELPSYLLLALSTNTDLFITPVVPPATAIKIVTFRRHVPTLGNEAPMAGPERDGNSPPE
jgi:hypothetical protein